MNLGGPEMEPLDAQHIHELLLHITCQNLNASKKAAIWSERQKATTVTSLIVQVLIAQRRKCSSEVSVLMGLLNQPIQKERRGAQYQKESTHVGHRRKNRARREGRIKF